MNETLNDRHIDRLTDTGGQTERPTDRPTDRRATQECKKMPTLKQCTDNCCPIIYESETNTRLFMTITHLK